MNKFLNRVTENQRPLPQYLNDFLDWLDIEKGLLSKSQENYKRFLERFLNWLKINKLENIKPKEVLRIKKLRDTEFFV